MKKIRYPKHIVVAILIATLLCSKGILTYAAGNTNLAEERSVSQNDIDETAKPEEEKAEGQKESREYAEGEIIIVLEEGGISTLRIEGADEDVENVGSEMQFMVVDIEDDMSVEEAVDYYSELPGVAYAQPNYIYELDDDEIWEEMAANDPYFQDQWYLDTLNISQAWDYMEGVPRTKVRVAIIDTGIDLMHPDLRANVNPEYCVNSSTEELKKTNGDLSNHGTHIAGIVGAVTGNGLGISGLSNNYAEIAAIQCSDGNTIFSSYVIRGIQYAMSIDADIINMSLGMNQNDLLLQDALKIAYDSGILIVCSAGNDGTDNKHYPSAYDSTIGVIATTKEGKKRLDASYGTDNFISAPGDMILSTIPGGKYASIGGSSMAAGVVTGVAADILSVNPDLSVEEVKNILSETATDTYTEGFDAYSGWGIVAADKAVARAIGAEEIPKEEPDKLPDTTEGFVRRLYRCCLNREADDAGLADWIGRLNSGRENGGQVASGFLFSEEFKNRNLSDEQYVNILYRVFLGREADASGKQYWLTKLYNGMSRLYVMNGFSASDEFAAICRQCGFEPGVVPCNEVRDQNEGITAFVARMYVKVLGRNFDEDGLNDWCSRILYQGWSPYRVATEGFFHSREFTSKNLSNSEFVKILYRSFLDREYDKAGYRDWLYQLNNGKSRDSVITGFANSREFANLMAKYGL